MISKYPDNSEILVLAGKIELAQNKPDEALQNYKAAIAKQPKIPAATMRCIISTSVGKLR